MRTWRILTHVIKRELCYFSERSIHSTCRHRSVVRWGLTFRIIFFITNKSNKVEGTVTNLKKSRYFERLTKYDRFKYLLKQLDGSSLRECVCVCLCVCIWLFMHLCLYMRARVRFVFHNSQHSNILNNKFYFFTNIFAILHACVTRNVGIIMDVNHYRNLIIV